MFQESVLKEQNAFSLFQLISRQSEYPNVLLTERRAA